MAKKAGKRGGSKGRSAKGGRKGKRTAKKAGKKTARRRKAKDYPHPIGPSLSPPGQVPLRLLEKRLQKLNALVLKRGGRYLTA